MRYDLKSRLFIAQQAVTDDRIHKYCYEDIISDDLIDLYENEIQQKWIFQKSNIFCIFISSSASFSSCSRIFCTVISILY